MKMATGRYSYPTFAPVNNMVSGHTVTPKIEKLIKEGIIVGKYVHLYDLPITRMKFRYQNFGKKKFIDMGVMGNIQLTYAKPGNRFILTANLNFKIPYTENFASVRFIIPQSQMYALLNMRNELRPIKLRNTKGPIQCRKLTPKTHEEAMASMRAKKEPNRIKDAAYKKKQKEIEERNKKQKKDTKKVAQCDLCAATLDKDGNCPFCG